MLTNFKPLTEQIPEYLSNYPNGLSPTNIGLLLGFEYTVASARVNLALQELVRNKVLYKEINSKKVLYKLIK